jgi:hypothetical protein
VRRNYLLVVSLWYYSRVCGEYVHGADRYHGYVPMGSR